MVNYRRSQTPGGCYFFTHTLQNRSATYLTDYIDHLRDAFRSVQQKRPFHTKAIVILPDHMHMLMQLPEGDNDYPNRWKLIKSQFTRALVKQGVGLQQNAKGEWNLWQRRYWEHEIRDDMDLQRHVDYIHFNPIKHGHCLRVVDWSYSSFHRYVDDGLLPTHWGDNFKPDDKINYGE